MRIAVDAMGGDYAPSVVVEGITAALYDFPEYEITVVGHLGKLSFYLEKYGIEDHPRIKKVHAETVVEMGEPSTTAIRGKKDSSITTCAKLLRNGEVDAVVSAGHTGAAVASTKVLARTLPGVERPAIATSMPAVSGRFILLDAGANTDCKPINLVQFALMGEVYAKYLFGSDNPSVGLLSVGGEDVKGNELTKEVFKMLSKLPINFVGNVEGDTIFENVADVVVCDGFMGNVLLKGCEGLAKTTMHWMKSVFSKNPLRMTSAMLSRNAFRELKAFGDSEELGGAPLLGINGICVIGHGSSSPKAVRNAIKVAGEFVNFGLNEKISRRIVETNEILSKLEKQSETTASDNAEK
jgi:glycerol-3-phosphate acyltransferase PlsX